MAHKWSESDYQFLREHKDTMTRAEIAKALGIDSPKKVSFAIRRLMLRELKSGKKEGKKHEKSILEDTKKATAPISTRNTKTSKKAKKVKGIVTGKYKSIALERFLVKDEREQETTSDLISKIRLCIIHKSPTHLSGHSKLRFVDDNYFVSLKNSQYLFFDENKSCFIPMNIFNGVPRKKGETRKLLDTWREQYLKNEKNQT